MPECEPVRFGGGCSTVGQRKKAALCVESLEGQLPLATFVVPLSSGTLFELARQESRETSVLLTSSKSRDFQAVVRLGWAEMLSPGGEFVSLSVSE
jgi:hypothetical protein